jgi:hypothetical protein
VLDNIESTFLYLAAWLFIITIIIAKVIKKIMK